MILKARRRSDTLPGAVECDDNGALYVVTGASVTQDVRVVDDADQSCMDNVNDALRVNVVAGGAGGGAATIADGADIAQGTTTDAEAAAGNGTVIALLKRLRTLLGGALAVTGTFWQATQPVSVADGADVAQGALGDAEVAGAGNASVIAILKRIRTLLGGSLSVTGTFWQVTQPISVAAAVTVAQATHDNLKANVNIQVGDADADVDNPVPVLAGGPFTAVLGLEAVAATTMYQLIDLSDAANYPHTSTTALILKRLRIHAEKAADGIFDVWVGVVIENDGTDGTAKWLHVFHLEAVGNPTDSTDRFAQELEFNLDLAVSAGALVNYVTNQQLANSALLKNDVARTSPVGTANPGVGDLMVYVEEVTDGGTLDFVISADYNAR